MKIIYSITKAQKKYDPQYSVEEEVEDTDNPSWSVPVTHGRRKKCKNGRVSIVKTRKDYSADSSFDAWAREEAQRPKELETKEEEDATVNESRPQAAASLQVESNSQPMVDAEAVRETLESIPTQAEATGQSVLRHPPNDADFNRLPVIERSVVEWCHGADEGSRVEVKYQETPRADPSPKPQVGIGKAQKEIEAVAGLQKHRAGTRIMPEKESHDDVSTLSKRPSATADAVPEVEVTQRSEAEKICKGVCIADRKRIKKKDKQLRRMRMFNATEQYEAIKRQAIRGYELFHNLPEGSATEAQVISTSAGINGYAEYVNQHIEDESLKKIIKLQEAIPEKKDLSILTKAGNGLPSISIVAPKGDEWEEIEITIESGACETVLPSRMLMSIKLQPNESSRRGVNTK